MPAKRKPWKRKIDAKLPGSFDYTTFLCAILAAVGLSIIFTPDFFLAKLGLVFESKEQALFAGLFTLLFSISVFLWNHRFNT